ncbi:hypothetical protein [Pseudomonas abietaniphila]|uniref:hypothetical protein n=1 Tax=Pseudomonas abietaniphila TaxID=89065 RepID=UPI000780359B|nr:hypothetical protein [Pseudomonas abietaniphila]
MNSEKIEKITPSPAFSNAVLPSWIHPASSAMEWYVPKTGTKVAPSDDPRTTKYVKISFDYELFDESSTADLVWNLFIRDLQASAIALIESSKSKRPYALVHFVRAAFEIADHVYEARHRSSKAAKIVTLADITLDDIKTFLEAHDLTLMGINLKELDLKLGSASRGVKNVVPLISEMQIPAITKKILIQKLKRNNLDNYREFTCTYTADEDDDADSLSVSTIKNKCTNLTYLHTTKECQIHQFEVGAHEISDAFNSISGSFIEKNQTPLMPANIAFHYISNAIIFHRDYASHIRKYINQLDEYYNKEIIAKYAASTIKSNVHTFKKQTLDAVPVPKALRHLNIKTYGQCGRSRGGIDCNSIMRDHISTDELIDFYAITTRILIHTFSACRVLSASLLDSNCLTVSKLDGLWDLKLKIPKTSNSHELETIKRPIPKVIWDFIYDYIEFMESRHPNMTSIWPSGRKKGNDRNETTLRKILDQYSDWIQVPNIGSTRWYARPHQFRRFFAAFFFYLSGSTEIESLRWMMGHIEPSVTLYYANIANQPDWERDTLEFLIDFLEGHVGKDVLVDEDLQEDFAEREFDIKLGDHTLLSEHLQELASRREIKIQIINNQKVFIYASK